jgi:hypothetical protein
LKLEFLIDIPSFLGAHLIGYAGPLNRLIGSTAIVNGRPQ